MENDDGGPGQRGSEQGQADDSEGGIPTLTRRTRGQSKQRDSGVDLYPGESWAQANMNKKLMPPKAARFIWETAAPNVKNKK